MAGAAFREVIAPFPRPAFLCHSNDSWSSVGRIIGAYGGPELMSAYPRGDRVSCVTIAYACSLPRESFDLEQQELVEVAWHDQEDTSALERHVWIDKALADALC